MAKQDSPTRPAKSSAAAPRPKRRTAVARANDFDASPETADGRSADASADASRSDSVSAEPSEESIRLRAYHRYLARGGGHGMAFDDWLEAERELKGRK